MQHVAGEAEVEGVSGDAGCRLQPAREREGPGLARLRSGEQSVLDLRGQAQWSGALAPLVQVGVPAGWRSPRRPAGVRAEAISPVASPSGSVGSRNSRRPIDLAALGDRGEHPPLVGAARESGAERDLHLCVRTVCSSGPPSKGRIVARSSTSRRSPAASGASPVRCSSSRGVRAPDGPAPAPRGRRSGRTRTWRRAPTRAHASPTRPPRPVRRVLRRVQHAAKRSGTPFALHFRSIGGSPSGVSHAPARRAVLLSS